MEKNCKECLHNSVCQMWRDQENQDASSFQLSGCSHFEDRSRFVKLPCKIGDLVWGIKRWNYGQKAIQGVVNQMYFGEDMRLCICVKNVCRGEWGKKVFATKEEAEAALAKMDGERKDN